MFTGIRDYFSRRQSPGFSAAYGGAESPLRAALNARVLGVHRTLFRSALGQGDRVQMYKQLSLLLKNGVPIEEALIELYVVESKPKNEIDRKVDRQEVIKQVLRESPSKPTAIVIQEMLRSLARGRSLTDVLAHWVTQQEISLIAAGEKSAKLPTAFNRAIFALKKRAELVKALILALTTPTLVFTGMLGAMFYIGFSLVPQFLALMPLEKWKGQTRSLIEIGLFVTAYWWLIIGAIAALIAAVTWTLSNLTGRIRDRLDRVPPWSIYRQFQGATFLMNVALMMASGISVEETLETMRRTANPYMAERLVNTLRGLRRGKNLGDALHHAEHGFPDPTSIAFMRVLASRAGFSEALEGSVEDWLDQSIDKIVKLAAIVRLVAIALAGFLLVELFSAIYGLSQATNNM